MNVNKIPKLAAYDVWGIFDYIYSKWKLAVTSSGKRFHNHSCMTEHTFICIGYTDMAKLSNSYTCWIQWLAIIGVSVETGIPKHRDFKTRNYSHSLFPLNFPFFLVRFSVTNICEARSNYEYTPKVLQHKWILNWSLICMWLHSSTPVVAFHTIFGISTAILNQPHNLQSPWIYLLECGMNRSEWRERERKIGWSITVSECNASFKYMCHMSSSQKLHCNCYSIL